MIRATLPTALSITGLRAQHARRLGRYGLALGAPYLHHGQAPTLPELFTDTKWAFHTNAGNANFSVMLGAPGKVDDLVAFLLSIDASTPEIAVPADATSGLSFDVCP